MRYERRGWRAIRPGDVIKDPRGDRTVELSMSWGYKPFPTEKDRYGFSRPWPKVGRLKVIVRGGLDPEPVLRDDVH